MKFPKQIIGLLIIAGLGYAVYNQYGSDLKMYLPKPGNIEESVLELKQTQKRLKSALLSSEHLRKARELFLAKKKNFWMPVIDGEPEAEIQSVVENAAREAGFSLNVVGNLRRTKVADGIVFMELNVAGSAAMPIIMEFLRRVSTSSPRFFWSRLVIRSTSIQSPDQLSLNGSVGFYYITDDSVSDFMTKGEVSL